MIRRSDLMVAGAATAWMLAVVAIVDDAAVGGRSVVLAILILAQHLSLVLWRAYPLLCQAIVWSVQLGVVWSLDHNYVVIGLAQVLVSFSLGMRLALGPGIALSLTLSALTVVAHVAWKQPQDLPAIANYLLQTLSFHVLPFLGGHMVAAEQRQAEATLEAATRQHERDLLSTFFQERRRLAGDLHDVAAHHVAGIVVQASAIERLVDRDPAAAKEAVAQLRRQAKETLTGLRSVVGLLRDDTAEPGIEDVPALVSSIEQLGVRIELRYPQTIELPRQESTAIYRVAQQAISNALQHSPDTWIRVELMQTASAVELVVANGATSKSDEDGHRGVGLNLMRERANAVGGELDAGPTNEHGWQVTLRLPRERQENR